MNNFTKSKIKEVLDRKVSNHEIWYYCLYPNKIYLRKSSRSGCSIPTDNIPPDVLLRFLQKRIPDPEKINTKDYFEMLTEKFQKTKTNFN